MLNLCGGEERESFIAKKFKSKIRVKAGPGAGGCAVTPPARPRPRPRPRRRRPWSGSSCHTAQGEEWVVTVGRPACRQPARPGTAGRYQARAL